MLKFGCCCRSVRRQTLWKIMNMDGISATIKGDFGLPFASLPSAFHHVMIQQEGPRQMLVSLFWTSEFPEV